MLFRSNILFLKDEGLYVYDFEAENESLVLPYDADLYGPATISMKLHISADGSRVLWKKFENELSVYDAVSWTQPLLLREKKVLVMVASDEYHWPTLSPDGKFIIVYQTDWGTKKDFVNERLTVYDTESFARNDIYNMDDYYFKYSALGDWR